MPERLQLTVGEQHAVRLPSLASGGYRWQATVEHAAVAEATVQLEPVAAGGPAAFSPFETLVVRALGVGRTRVRVVQRRTWEDTSAALASHEIVVDVVAATDLQSSKEARAHEP